MIKMIGVVGAGQMGNGIAHVCAAAGYDVRLLDVNQDAIDRGLKTITGNLDRQVAKNMLTAEQKAATLARIAIGLDYAIFRECDLVIEAAPENEALKKTIQRFKP